MVEEIRPHLYRIVVPLPDNPLKEINSYTLTSDDRNLVIDTGIHAKRWTREESIDYFLENTPLSEGDIVTEVERFFVNPGQALGYKMGMIKILELRERAKNELGSAYDIREFHDAVIGAGSLPLQLLEQQVERYISAKR